VLSRGYALIQKETVGNQEVISRIQQLNKEDNVKIQFSDGTATAQIKNISNRKDPS